MVPLWILKVSCRTLATGARQFVVHEALEMMLCFPGSYLPSFTPSTMVMSSFFAGAEMMTFFTGPRRWALAFSASVNFPVDSITTCAPTDSQLMAAGSFSEKTFMGFPSITMESPVALMSCFKLPRIESYLSKWARVAGLVRSLTATNSISVLSIAVRRTLRPIRPKPLIPTFTGMGMIPPRKNPELCQCESTEIDEQAEPGETIQVNKHTLSRANAGRRLPGEC